MYTSGTTGDPKGVMISNESILCLLTGVNRVLESVKESVIYFSFQSHICVQVSIPYSLK